MSSLEINNILGNAGTEIFVTDKTLLAAICLSSTVM